MILTVEASAAQARCDFRRKELSSNFKKTRDLIKGYIYELQKQ